MVSIDYVLVLVMEILGGIAEEIIKAVGG